MTTENTATAAQPSPTTIDWHEVARTALGSAFLAGLVGGALHVVAKMVEADLRVRATSPGCATAGNEATPANASVLEEEEEPDENDESHAARLLGVSLDATDTEIRAALRARLASSRLHPDHGGDGEEAKQLIAAKNLLIERLRSAS